VGQALQALVSAAHSPAPALQIPCHEPRWNGILMMIAGEPDAEATGFPPSASGIAPRGSRRTCRREPQMPRYYPQFHASKNNKKKEQIRYFARMVTVLDSTWACSASSRIRRISSVSNGLAAPATALGPMPLVPAPCEGGIGAARADSGCRERKRAARDSSLRAAGRQSLRSESGWQGRRFIITHSGAGSLLLIPRSSSSLLRISASDSGVGAGVRSCCSRRTSSASSVGGSFADAAFGRGGTLTPCGGGAGSLGAGAAGGAVERREVSCRSWSKSRSCLEAIDVSIAFPPTRCPALKMFRWTR
jgi:hypothetical protein